MATNRGFTYYYFLNYHFWTLITGSLIDGGCLKGRQFKEGSTVVVCYQQTIPRCLHACSPD